MFNKKHPDTDNIKMIIKIINNRIKALSLDVDWYIQHARVNHNSTEIYELAKQQRDKTNRWLQIMKLMKKEATALLKNINKIISKDSFDVLQLSKTNYAMLYKQYNTISLEMIR